MSHPARARARAHWAPRTPRTSEQQRGRAASAVRTGRLASSSHISIGSVLGLAQAPAALHPPQPISAADRGTCGTGVLLLLRL